MKCSEREQAVALYAGGDLPTSAELERHLAECADCREAVDSVRAAMEWAREAHAEPIAPAHYAAVRERVLAELARERRLSWWGRLSIGGRLLTPPSPPQFDSLPHRQRRGWAWGVAGAAAILAIVLLFPARVRTPDAVGQGFGPAAALLGGVPEQTPKVAPVRPRRPKGRRQPKRADPTVGQAYQPAAQLAVAEPQPSQPLVIKLFTEDPNVVIYWIAESKGD